MRKVQQRASLSERTVQSIARGSVKMPKARGKASRKPSSKVKTSHWSDGVDPRIVAEIKAMNIPQVWRRIEVVGPEEVIIHNNSRWNQ